MSYEKLQKRANMAIDRGSNDLAQVHATMAVADRLEALVNVMDSIRERVERIEHHVNEGLLR